MKCFAIILLTAAFAIAGPHDAEIATMQTQLDAAQAFAAAGNRDDAADECTRAFRTFENSMFHNALAGKDHDLYRTLEGDWLALVRALEKEDTSAIQRRRKALDADFKAATALFEAPPSPKSAAFNAFFILFREGFEALLILGAIVATLRQMGRKEMTRVVWVGAGLALVATGGLYWLSLKVLKISGAGREILEGVTLLVACAVLFWMSYWLVSKIDGKRWQAFIAQNVKKALSGGNAFALGSLAFLVVFREGFETVLMMRALEAGGAGWGPVLAGMGVATVVLTGVYFAIIVAGVRLPIRAFFSVTSAVLLTLVFKFAGDGIMELQEGGAVSMTPVSWVPASDFLRTWLGIHPNVECLSLQGVVLFLIAAGLAWTFLRRSPEALPPPPSAPKPEARVEPAGVSR